MADRPRIQSMTGFARRDGEVAGWRWAWEMRSVNGRGVDLRLRMPSGFEELEAELRASTASSLGRGTVHATLAAQDDDKRGEVVLNERALGQILEHARTLADRVGATPPTVDGLLGLKGVLEIETPTLSDADLAARMAAVRSGFETALADLLAARISEGGRIETVLLGQMEMVGKLASEADRIAADLPVTRRDRLAKQMAELLEPGQALSEERMAQEIALLVNRADVREEIDRLKAHVDAVRGALAGGGAVGRRLDFLAQELNREANTLCSKSPDLALTQVGLELKMVIDQFREQVQNIA